MATRSKGKALAYLRRSTSRQEVSLTTQLEWACQQAALHAVRLDASPADLEQMQATRVTSLKGLRIDDGRTGADMARPGFLALIQDAKSDRSISHLFIYHRDRFARPQEAMQMVVIEKDLRLAGLTIVFADGVAGPLTPGLSDLTADLVMMLAYHESGQFIPKHAERIIQAQRQLAPWAATARAATPRTASGRALVDAGGGRVMVQELPTGMTARRPGCHVRLIPKDRDKIGVWLFILELRERGWGYKRIAQHLNVAGIPSPGAGSVRTDQGVKHVVSGRWCANTIKELCNNRAILGLQDYGRRSEGKHRRLGPDGPRLLADADRDAAERPRVVMNDVSLRITTQLGTEPLCDAGEAPMGADPGDGRRASGHDPAGRATRQGPGALSAGDAAGRLE